MANCIQHRKAIHAGHVDIGDHNIGQHRARNDQTMLTIRCRCDFIAFKTEQALNILANRLLVVNHQNSIHASYLLLSRCQC